GSLADVPLVYTVHHVRDDVLQPLYVHTRSQHIHLAAISARQRELLELPAEVVHHGLDETAYPCGPGGEHAAFIRRFAAGKGVHAAVDAAHEAAVPLVLGGKPHWKDHDYFKSQVEKRLGRPGVRWVGEVGHERKCAVLGAACATLVPIQW